MTHTDQEKFRQIVLSSKPDDIEARLKAWDLYINNDFFPGIIKLNSQFIELQRRNIAKIVAGIPIDDNFRNMSTFPVELALKGDSLLKRLNFNGDEVQTAKLFFESMLGDIEPRTQKE
jgi:hypothetical protein